MTISAESLGHAIGVEMSHRYQFSRLRRCIVKFRKPAIQSDPSRCVRHRMFGWAV
jgi:hypothetical protein